MTDRIYTRDGVKLVEKAGGRDPLKLYSDIGVDADGARRLLEWTDTEKEARTAEVAAWRPVEPKDELAELKARVSALEAGRK